MLKWRFWWVLRIWISVWGDVTAMVGWLVHAFTQCQADKKKLPWFLCFFSPSPKRYFYLAILHHVKWDTFELKHKDHTNRFVFVWWYSLGGKNLNHQSTFHGNLRVPPPNAPPMPPPQWPGRNVVIIQSMPPTSYKSGPITSPISGWNKFRNTHLCSDIYIGAP